MSHRQAVVFTRRAGDQVDGAARWWRDHRGKAPDAFREELARVLEIIATQPGVGAVAANVRLAGVQRIYMHRTGHYLYYRVQRERKIVQVVGIWHASRGSEPRF